MNIHWNSTGVMEHNVWEITDAAKYADCDTQGKLFAFFPRIPSEKLKTLLSSSFLPHSWKPVLLPACMNTPMSVAIYTKLDLALDNN